MTFGEGVRRVIRVLLRIDFRPFAAVAQDLVQAVAAQEKTHLDEQK